MAIINKLVWVFFVALSLLLVSLEARGGVAVDFLTGRIGSKSLKEFILDNRLVTNVGELALDSSDGVGSKHRQFTAILETKASLMEIANEFSESVLKILNSGDGKVTRTSKSYPPNSFGFTYKENDGQLLIVNSIFYKEEGSVRIVIFVSRVGN